jgi:hypothetical protein
MLLALVVFLGHAAVGLAEDNTQQMQMKIATLMRAFSSDGKDVAPLMGKQDDCGIFLALHDLHATVVGADLLAHGITTMLQLYAIPQSQADRRAAQAVIAPAIAIDVRTLNIYVDIADAAAKHLRSTLPAASDLAERLKNRIRDLSDVAREVRFE